MALALRRSMYIAGRLGRMHPYEGQGSHCRRPIKILSIRICLLARQRRMPCIACDRACVRKARHAIIGCGRFSAQKLQRLATRAPRHLSSGRAPSSTARAAGGCAAGLGTIEWLLQTRRMLSGIGVREQAAQSFQLSGLAAAMEGPGVPAPRSAGAQPSRTYSPDIEWDPEVKQYLESAFGAAKLAAMSAALARPPLTTCLRVNTLRTTPQVGGQRRCHAANRCPANCNPDPEHDFVGSSSRCQRWRSLLQPSHIPHTYHPPHPSRTCCAVCPPCSRPRTASCCGSAPRTCTPSCRMQSSCRGRAPTPSTTHPAVRRRRRRCRLVLPPPAHMLCPGPEGRGTGGSCGSLAAQHGRDLDNSAALDAGGPRRSRSEPGCDAHNPPPCR